MGHVRALLPSAGLHTHEAVHDRIVNHGSTGELIVTPEVADTFQTDPRYIDLFEEMVATGRFAVLSYEGNISVPV